MRGVFDEREVAEAKAQHDTELTLGSTTLLLIFFGLVLICGLCFGLGYTIGHHGTADGGSPQSAAANTAAPADSGQLKPSANVQAAAPVQPDSAVNDSQTESSSTAGAAEQDAAIAAVGQHTTAPDALAPADLPDRSTHPQVKPGLGTVAVSPTAASPSIAQATGAPASIMVQIAAVSAQEDADVLMGALRKRGYAVAARREPLDGLVHVRIGPFKSKDEAERWRQKLLNDGYNAIVQQ